MRDKNQLERMVKENSFNIEVLGKSLTSVYDDVMVLQKEYGLFEQSNENLDTDKRVIADALDVVHRLGRLKASMMIED